MLSIACNMFHDRYPRRGYMISFDFATLNIICGELISQRQQNLKKCLHVPLSYHGDTDLEGFTLIVIRALRNEDKRR